jgi:ribosome-associated protein
MKNVNWDFPIPENELDFEFVQSSGPGGQKVNKTATAVQLRFNIDRSNILTDRVKRKLKIIGKKRINQRGELIIRASRFRTQAENREDALTRLQILIQKAKYVSKKRKRTRPTYSSTQKRLQKKKIHAQKKKNRSIRFEE